jgi:solute carrier family 8 (sodium/calcium exchanger)
MGKRFGLAAARQPLMARIKCKANNYMKRCGIMVVAGLAMIFGCLYFNNDDHVVAGLGGRALLETKICNGDTVLPIIPYENTWDTVDRAILYFFFLVYLFLGVAISADCFMASIEIITAETTSINVNGEDVEVEVWNSTVANLTLMALGSSAPEILLAVVETVSLKFESGDLGPGTIVGSAAFNLLFITAICISALPEVEGDENTLESRKIEEFGVFGITAVASLFAYLWMVIVLTWVSKDEVHVWEALVTLAMFPALVWVSWAQDNGWWGYFGDDQVTPEGHGVVKSITGSDGKTRRVSASNAIDAAGGDGEAVNDDAKKDAAKAAAHAEMKKKKKSRLEYRIQATRKMTGGKRVHATNKKLSDIEEDKEQGPSDSINIGFDKIKYEFDESCGTAVVKVIRGGITDKAASISFDTSDGDAHAGDDYIAANGTLDFAAGETEKPISITVIDDNEWAPDKVFYIRIFAKEGSGVNVTTSTTAVTILNDDDPGTIEFKEKTCVANNTKETVKIPIIRKDGYDGNVLVFAKSTDGSAIAGEDYNALSEDCEVHFEHGVRESFLEIELLKNANKQNSEFRVEITGVEPEGAKVGDVGVCLVVISDDKNYQRLVQEVVELMDDEMDKYSIGTSSWNEQFHDAMNMGTDDDAEPEWSDYLLHFLSFYWKVFHALVPPTDYYGGWATFWVSLLFIGAITVLVGDTAKMLGCVIGLEDGITAITFVALGTSLPDTFASMEATVSDDTADAAITNVTGSNSVNVFLGLGLPWCMATFYHLGKGTTLMYPAGDLSFSVLVYFAFAVACILLLVYRRFYCDGELGGPKTQAYVHSGFLYASWFAYIVISSMKTKGKI